MENAMQEVKQHTAIIQDVEVIYPRLDRPYVFSKQENQSVPCEWDEKDAAFTVSLVVPYEKALPLRKAMHLAYEEKKEDSWPKFQDNFKLVEGSLKGKDAVFHIKTKLKSYDKDTKVRQYDADNNPLPVGFQLTRGSTVNAMVTLVPYSSGMGEGVSLRLSAIQVTKLAAMQQSASPFGRVEGYTQENASPFKEPVATSGVEDAVVKNTDDSGAEWGDEAEEPKEPKKTVSKKKATPEPKNDIDDDLDSIIDDWAQ